jgi:hypothetical protein
MNKRASFAAYLSLFIVIGACDAVYGALSIYESKGKRDPFVPLVGFERGTYADLSEVSSPDDLVLEGIAKGAGGKRVAIINGQMLKENSKIGNLEIIKVSDRSVTVLIAGTQHKLELSEEGG